MNEQLSKNDKDTILNILKKYPIINFSEEIKNLENSLKKNAKIKKRNLEISEMYSKGINPKEIAKKFDFTSKYIINILKKEKVWIYTQHIQKEKICKRNCHILYDHFILKISYKELSIKYKLSLSRLHCLTTMRYYIHNIMEYMHVYLPKKECDILKKVIVNAIKIGKI